MYEYGAEMGSENIQNFKRLQTFIKECQNFHLYAGQKK